MLEQAAVKDLTMVVLLWVVAVVMVIVMVIIWVLMEMLKAKEIVRGD